jgi:hypothetical protein
VADHPARLLVAESNRFTGVTRFSRESVESV